MENYLIFSTSIIKFVLPFLIGSLVFFSTIIAPNTFINLDTKNARKFIRSTFPKLYLWSLIISLILTILMLFIDVLFGVVLFFVSFGFFFSRQYLTRWINEASDLSTKSKNQKKKFNRLHTLSVSIFISQILCLTVISFIF